MPLRTDVAAVLVLCTAALGGCGGGGKDSEQIRSAIKASADLGSRDVCTSDFTERGLQQFFRETTSAAAARRDCLANVGHSRVKGSQLSFGAITVHGSSATTVASLGSRRLKFTLVKQGSWKIDTVAAQ